MKTIALGPLLHRLPILPSCAGQVIRLGRKGLTAEQLIQMAGTDQILAGSLIQAANSAAYSWSGTVSTLPQAVMYLGEVRGTQVLLAAAMKPMLAVVGHKQLFDHSMEVAHVALRLVSSTQLVPAAEAYVLGLMHDVGQLLFKLTGLENARRVEELVKSGAERFTAETMVYGVSHAEAGATVLRHWRMPEDCAAAVSCHHSPELGGGLGAAMLYLAEQWTDPDGDPMCERRVKYALDLLRLDPVEFNLQPIPAESRQASI